MYYWRKIPESSPQEYAYHNLQITELEFKMRNKKREELQKSSPLWLTVWCEWCASHINILCCTFLMKDASDFNEKSIIVFNVTSVLWKNA